MVCEKSHVHVKMECTCVAKPGGGHTAVLQFHQTRCTRPTLPPQRKCNHVRKGDLNHADRPGRLVRRRTTIWVGGALLCVFDIFHPGPGSDFLKPLVPDSLSKHIRHDVLIHPDGPGWFARTGTFMSQWNAHASLSFLWTQMSSPSRHGGSI